MNKKAGFSLVEILVVMAIIGILASIIMASLVRARGKARDVRRKAELSQIGRFLTGTSCYIPDAGEGDYDILQLVEELKIKYPQNAQMMNQIPRDPRAGTETEAFYRYIVSTDGTTKCAIYANLEGESEPVTLTGITAPTAGGGTGVLRASSDGWNGTPIYLQYSN